MSWFPASDSTLLTRQMSLHQPHPSRGQGSSHESVTRTVIALHVWPRSGRRSECELKDTSWCGHNSSSDVSLSSTDFVQKVVSGRGLVADVVSSRRLDHAAQPCARRCCVVPHQRTCMLSAYPNLRRTFPSPQTVYSLFNLFTIINVSTNVTGVMNRVMDQFGNHINLFMLL